MSGMLRPRQMAKAWGVVGKDEAGFRWYLVNTRMFLLLQGTNSEEGTRDLVEKMNPD